jgi:hypothetical protein
MDSIFLPWMGQLFPRLCFSTGNFPDFPPAGMVLPVSSAHTIHALVAVRHYVGVLRA